jgi:hypothetical protein
MKVGDWVDTPQGIGKVSSFSNSYTRDKMNVFVLIGEKLYAFAINLVEPLTKEVVDVFIASQFPKEERWNTGWADSRSIFNQLKGEVK